MAWTNEHEELAALIAEIAPINLLLRLRYPGVDLRVDTWRKEFTEDDRQSQLALARRIVSAYEDSNALQALINSLTRGLASDDVAIGRLARFAALGGRPVQQAALALRANFMRSRPLRQFLEQCEPRVCVVAADAGIACYLGTGFLVGADLILTAYHTLKDHIQSGEVKAPAPGRLVAIFDHFEGPPIYGVDGPEPAKVEFATDWLLACSDDFPRDGLISNPTVEEIAELKARLDFALVRLAEPVGRRSYAEGGGKRRSWFAVPPARVPLLVDQRIIIPQHPLGFPQQIDIGRFFQDCPSGTRIRYTTETEEGTSGAPCFDEQFQLVGLHNAVYHPNGQLLGNQAVRVDWIAANLAPHLGAAQPGTSASRLWNTAPPQEPLSPILGREELLNWIESAATDQVFAHERAFAVVGAQAKSGRKFSVQILRAALRDSADRIVEFDAETMPRTVRDLVRQLCDQLAIPADALDELTPRPTAQDTEESDKLHEWASNVAPLDLDRLLQRHRIQEIDERELARESVELAQRRSRTADPDDVRLANEPAPVRSVRTRWERIWFLVRADVSISAEVADLIGGLVRFGGAGTAAELSRVRWLFIGDVPEFMQLHPDAVERLDPLDIGTDDVVEYANAIADSLGGVYPEEARTNLEGITNAFTQLLDVGEAANRLPSLQNLVARLTPSIMAEVR